MPVFFYVQQNIQKLYVCVYLCVHRPQIKKREYKGEKQKLKEVRNREDYELMLLEKERRF